MQLEQFVARVVSQAENEKAGLIVFKLDTPGGLVEAMRGITQTILASRVPIAMWVPPGGRAASAGAFMMQAAHIAAMSSVSNLGAAHPVVASGGDIPDTDMKKKITEDLGGLDKFKTDFAAAGVGQFGSGWCWLSVKNGKLEISKTANGESPLVYGGKPILGVDVWEHSYYIDYRNARPKYLEAFVDSMINWDYVLELYEKA